MATLQSIGYQGQTFNVPDPLDTPLTGLDTSLTGAVTASDTVVQAFGKLQNFAQQEQVAITHFVDCIANPATQNSELPSYVFSWAWVMLRRVGSTVTARFRAEVKAAGSCRVSIPHAFIPADGSGVHAFSDGQGGIWNLNFNEYSPGNPAADNTLWISVGSTAISTTLDVTANFSTPF